jgi:hypothetical protein
VNSGQHISNDSNSREFTFCCCISLWENSVDLAADRGRIETVISVKIDKIKRAAKVCEYFGHRPQSLTAGKNIFGEGEFQGVEADRQRNLPKRVRLRMPPTHFLKNLYSPTPFPTSSYDSTFQKNQNIS